MVHQPAVESSLQEWALILYHAAWYAWARGNYVEAETMALKAARSRKKVLGQENAETLNSMAMLALVYKDEGRWKEAEEMDVQVMETRKRVLGQEHPDTLSSMANLAFTWKSQGRNPEAILMLKECYQLQTHKLGSQHPATESSFETLNKWQMESLTVEA